MAIGVYDDPPGRDEIEAALAGAGLGRADREAFAAVEALAQALDPGDFAQFVAKLGLYKRGDPAPLARSRRRGLRAAGGRGRARRAGRRSPPTATTGRLAAAIRRLGGSPTSLTIAAGRHFRTLYAAALASEGVEAGLARARPPVFGPKRARMAAQARAYGSSGSSRRSG